MSGHVLTDGEAQDLIDAGVTAWEIVRLGFPGADRDMCDFLLWEKTPFPLLRGVHDIADAVEALVIDGPRCDEETERAPHFRCRRKVSTWGDSCHVHRPSLVVRRAQAGVTA